MRWILDRVYVLTVYKENASVICRYISLLFDFNNLSHYNLFCLSKCFVQCCQNSTNFILRLT